MLLRKVQIARGGLQVSMTEQHLNGAQVGAGFEQMRCPTVAQGMGGNMFGDLGSMGGIVASDPNRLVGNWLLGPGTAAPGEQISLGFRQRQYSRRVSSSGGLSGRSRSLPPLPWTTRMSMRLLSMSLNLR